MSYFPDVFLITSKKIDFSAFKEFETDLGRAKNNFSLSYFQVSQYEKVYFTQNDESFE